MSDQTLGSLHKGSVPSAAEGLALRQQELDLILAIDHVRDTVPEPSAMLAAIANVLTEHFQADLCLLCLLDRETGELELKAVTDRSERFSYLDRALMERIARAETTVVWEEHAGVPEPEQAPLRTLHMVAIPIVMGTDQRLGAVLLGRYQAPFSEDDVELLKTAESQIDSAVVQGYAYYDLQQRNKELETIYRVDRIRDLQLPFDEMLNATLQELRGVIQAEMGFIMLYNPGKRQLELRASTHDDIFWVSPYHETVYRVADEALDQADVVCHNDLGDVLRSMLCIPLILRDEIIGVLGVANRYGPQGFRAEDRRLLRAIGSQMDTAIFESLERRRLRQVLGRSLDPRVMERLLANPDVEFLKGERALLSILYTDMRGSTSLAERTPPELLVGFINDYLGRMADIILSHEGTLDKFTGDGVIALFGAPFTQPDHALRAVQVGLEMQVTHQAIMEAWRARGVDSVPIGVGIASGEMTAGEIGCPQRTNYTVIGRPANLGSRICGAAAGGQVLISQTTYDLVSDHVEATPIAGLQLKGVGYDVTAYHVTRLLD